MSEPLEILVCTYNRAAQLDRCLSTMAKQTAPWDTWRVTVIDNASTDHTKAVVARHAEAGRLPGLSRILEPLQGLQEARRRGLTSVTGRWCAFVDDDCHLDPGWIMAARRVAAAHPHAGAIGGRVVIHWSVPVPAALRRNGWLFAEQDHGDAPKEVQALVGTGLVLNREALAKTGWTAAPLVADRIGRDLTSGGDVEITQRLAAAGYVLRYEPAMQLLHHIDRERLRRREVLRLSGGLGAGAALIRVMKIGPEELSNERSDVRARISAHRRLLLWALRHGELYDWRIHHAFLVAKDRSLARIAVNPGALQRLAGNLPRD